MQNCKQKVASLIDTKKDAMVKKMSNHNLPTGSRVNMLRELGNGLGEKAKKICSSCQEYSQDCDIDKLAQQDLNTVIQGL